MSAPENSAGRSCDPPVRDNGGRLHTCDDCGKSCRDPYWRNPFSGRTTNSRCWCPDCYERLSAKHIRLSMEPDRRW